jgi:hypothetical protein
MASCRAAVDPVRVQPPTWLSASNQTSTDSAVTRLSTIWREMMADSLGVKSNPNSIFGVASASDIRRVAAASGFWFQWNSSAQQYDHPSVVEAVDRGRVIRLLVGANVPSASLKEVVQELRGKFVASCARAGKVGLRCLEYDPNRGG